LPHPIAAIQKEQDITLTRTKVATGAERAEVGLRSLHWLHARYPACWPGSWRWVGATFKMSQCTFQPVNGR
jgi:hypothetical protein